MRKKELEELLRLIKEETMEKVIKETQFIQPYPHCPKYEPWQYEVTCNPSNVTLDNITVSSKSISETADKIIEALNQSITTT